PGNRRRACDIGDAGERQPQCESSWPYPTDDCGYEDDRKEWNANCDLVHEVAQRQLERKNGEHSGNPKNIASLAFEAAGEDSLQKAPLQSWYVARLHQCSPLRTLPRKNS